jgi:hypothetical protein
MRSFYLAYRNILQTTSGHSSAAPRTIQTLFGQSADANPLVSFRLSIAEFEHWKSQSVISNPSAKMGLRRAPFVFTQEGVAMLSAVLRSDRAVQMSIAIVRPFVRMRELMASNRDIEARVDKLERGHDRTASVIEVLVEDIDRLAREVKDMKALPRVTKRRIGFILDDE